MVLQLMSTLKTFMLGSYILPCVVLFLSGDINPHCTLENNILSWNMTRLGNLGFFLGKLEILIVALSKSNYQSQGSRVQLPVGA